MNNWIPIFYLSFFICLALPIFGQFNTLNSQDKFPTFEDYVLKFNKTYQSQKEYLRRSIIYEENVLAMINSNCQSCGANFFADWTLQQVQRLRTAKKSIKKDQIGATANKHGRSFGRMLTEEVPVHFDWRTNTTMTSVKSQGVCGASWAFSASAFYQQDSILNKTANSTIDFSEQYLITCNLQNQGCAGGYLQSSMDLVIRRGGIPLESQYIYNAYRSQSANICFQPNLFHTPNRSRMSYYDISNPEIIKKIILKKPVNIGLCGVDLVQYYPSNQSDSSRTLKCKASHRVMDHAVLLVGYTQTQWIIKNQWGTGWGFNGYAYISRKPSEDCCIGEQMYSSGQISDTCTVEHCSTCVEHDTCYKCQVGRYVMHHQTTGIQTCELCVQANCSQCYNYFGTCKWCNDGYAVNATTGKCVVTNITNCNRFSGTLCNQCKKGYKPSSNRNTCLLTCSTKNCLNCTEGPCTNCKIGFSLFSDIVNGYNTNFCKLNPCTVANCSYCDTNDSCLICYGKFSLVNNTCVNLCTLAGCVSCVTGSTTCDQCIQGKSYNSSTKVCQVFTPVANCKVHKINCTTCRTGYAFNSAKTACVQTCDTTSCTACKLTDITLCSACTTGYYLNTTTYQSICIAYTCTIPNCTLCDSTGNTTCYTCIDKYHIFNNVTKICQLQCALDNCVNCLPNATACILCKAGYAVKYQTNLCVLSNISNCPMIDQSLGYLSCTSCATGYYPDTSDWLTCIIWCTDINCQVCSLSSLDICTQCYPGYSFTMNNGRINCTYNYPLMEGCIYITTNQTYCFQCDQFHVNNNGVCQLNTQNCKPQCDYCTLPQYQDTAYACKCKDGLQFEWFSELCINTTHDSNVTIDSKCFVIQLLSGNYNCFMCIDGYVVNYNQTFCVSQCSAPNCSICTNGYYDQCAVCNDGFYVNASLCKPCSVANCMTCTSTVCYDCMPGYQMNNRRDFCNKVSCLVGFIFDGYQCICPVGTYQGPDACHDCTQTNCVECSQTQCQRCTVGYFVAQNICKICQPNCISCSSATVCTECVFGYFFDSVQSVCVSIQNEGNAYNIIGNTVVVCSINCVYCVVSQVCQTCANGFSLSSGSCTPCSGNCSTCIQGSPSRCSTCISGFYISGYSCLPCNQANCEQCPTTVSICVSCQRGYYLNNATCVSCLTETCLNCNYKGQCTQCVIGFVLLADFTCQRCTGNCLSCSPTNLTQCVLACNQNQYLQNSTCTNCPQTCKKCFSQTQCQTCIDGYILRNNLCVKKCDVGCFQCDPQVTQICTRCYAGYILSDSGICQQDIVCNQDENCTNCPDNWSVVNSVCEICNTGSNCVQCANGNVNDCVRCKDQFYLENRSCQVCPYDCLSCISAQKCTKCRGAYFILYTAAYGSCVACDTECKTCTYISSQCTSCYDEYELSVTSKCLTVQKIQISIQLDAALSDYLSIADTLINQLAGLYGQNNTDASLLVVTDLYEASIVISVSMGLPNGLTGQQALTTVSDTLNNAQQLAGKPIIAVLKINLKKPPVPPVDNTSTTDPFQQPFENSLNAVTIGLAVGIPLAVISLVILGYALKRYYLTKRNIIDNQNDNVLRQKQNQSMTQIHVKPKLVPLQNINNFTPMKQEKDSFNNTGFNMTNNFNSTTGYLNQQQSFQRLDDQNFNSRVELINQFDDATLHQIVNEMDGKKIQGDKLGQIGGQLSQINGQHQNVLDEIQDNLLQNNESKRQVNDQLYDQDETRRGLKDQTPMINTQTDFNYNPNGPTKDIQIKGATGDNKHLQIIQLSEDNNQEESFY